MKHLLILAAVLFIVVMRTTLAQTWVSLNGPQIASDVKDISLTTDGVYRSTDAYSTNGGGAWSKLTNLPENDVKSIAIGSGSTIFAGTANSLYKSSDNGSTWTEVGKINVPSSHKQRGTAKRGFGDRQGAARSGFDSPHLRNRMIRRIDQ